MNALCLLVILSLASSGLADKPEKGKEIELLDGKSLKGWKVTDFGGQGEVTVENGAVVLEMGSDLTGVTLEKDPPFSMNYEISLEAKRSAGGDFFCGLTFPVEKSHCSLIVGGWGGGLVGLSSLNGADASENDTSSWHNFEKNRWYKIRLKVTPGRIQAWIDDKEVVNADVSDREIGTRPEVVLSRPLGIASWRTTAEIRHIRIKEVAVGESP